MRPYRVVPLGQDLTPSQADALLLPFAYLRTDSASFRFSRQRIVQLLSPRTASASLLLVAEADAVRDTWALVCSRSSAARVRASVPVTPRETSPIAGKTRAALPDHRPPVSTRSRPAMQAGTAPNRRRKCRLRPTFQGGK